MMTSFLNSFYTRHTSSCLGVGCVTRPILGLAPSGPLQAAFKSAFADLSLTPGTILSKLLGLRSVAAYKQLELFWVYLMARSRD